MNSVIGAIRHHLAHSDRDVVGLPAIPDRPTSRGDQVDSFIARATSAGSQCIAAQDIAEARIRVATLCTSRGLRTIARSDSDVVQQMFAVPDEGMTVVEGIDDRNELFHVDAGVTQAQWGIAETGTLVLTSSTERHRLTSLVPPVHIALLPASNIVATMPLVLERIATSGTRHQAITFITGPSRTADIELSLVVGVHGPRELHIVVLLDE